MNAIPKIETFEHDIVTEVEGKNSNISDIASYSEEVSSNRIEKERKTNFILLTTSFILMILSVVIIIVYSFISRRPVVTPVETPESKLQINNGSKEKIVYLFPNLNANVGNFISNFEVTPFGYNITVSDFKQVFAFIMKNESDFAEDMLTSFKINLGSEIKRSDLILRDTTDSNQSMRVLEINGKTIVYAWVNDKHLLVSETINGILSMRSDIIK